MKINSIKVLRYITTIIITTTLFLISKFILNSAVAWPRVTFFILGFLIWKCILDLHLYFSIMKYGNSGIGILTNCQMPLLVSGYFSGRILKGRWPNITLRNILTVKFYLDQEERNMEIWGAFYATPAEIGNELNIIYWEEYPSQVILAESLYKKIYVVHTIVYCLILGGGVIAVLNAF